jgi:hypothetical protein
VDNGKEFDTWSSFFFSHDDDDDDDDGCFDGCAGD